MAWVDDKGGRRSRSAGVRMNAFARRRTSAGPTAARVTAARVTAVVACALLAATVAGCGGSAPAASPQQQAAARFLAGYARSDGRVVRPDQGGDTVSEGQAYGMLLAEVAGNDAAFGRIWGWTRKHLQLGNGLFAFHTNAAGHVVGTQPASDADLLIAWALLRYHGPGAAAWHRDGSRVAAAILAHEVTTGPGGTPILAAGPWATGRPASLDPSYWSPSALRGIAQATGSAKWQQLATGAVTLTRELTHDGRLLPPDWAELTAAGVLRPEPAPDRSAPQTQYGLDAQRSVVWFAASCDPQARALAARWWPLLRPAGRDQSLALRPDGTVLDGTASVLPLVATAAAAKAAGQPAAERHLLGQAAALQRSHPTYYGGAWQALGTILLTSGVLSGC
jgi:endoglucanase